MSFFSITHAIGDVMAIFFKSDAHGDPTITVASQTIVSSVISEIFTLNVQAFLICIHFENVFIH
jgi:hypothetical protein